MLITLYKDGGPVGQRDIPDNISQMAVDLSRWMEMNDITQLHGIGPVSGFQRQILELIEAKERIREDLVFATAVVLDLKKKQK